MSFMKWGLGRKKDSLRALEVDRRIVRFHRMVEQHRDLLDLFSDLKDKQSGEYILDRQYIEAQLDSAFEGGRRILYDMHVISGSKADTGYEELDRVRSRSEEILREHQAAKKGPAEWETEQEDDWEILALRKICDHLTGFQGHSVEIPDRIRAETPRPSTLVEWVGWAHVVAAQWMADRLPSLAVDPVRRQGGILGNRFFLDVFPLGGMHRNRENLARCLEQGSAVHEDALDLLPLCYFMEGLAPLREASSAAQAPAPHPDRSGSAEPTEGLHLHAGGGFLMLQLPPSLPLRLLLCSLSMHESENLFYLFGTASSSFSNAVSCRMESEREPFPCYVSNTLSGTWMYWASGFSWAQGEEQLRVLGHLLSDCLYPSRGEDTPEDVPACMWKGLQIWLADATQQASLFSDRSGV
jgi:hypothetical protein